MGNVTSNEKLNLDVEGFPNPPPPGVFLARAVLP